MTDNLDPSMAIQLAQGAQGLGEAIDIATTAQKKGHNQTMYAAARDIHNYQRPTPEEAKETWKRFKI